MLLLFSSSLMELAAEEEETVSLPLYRVRRQQDLSQQMSDEDTLELDRLSPIPPASEETQPKTLSEVSPIATTSKKPRRKTTSTPEKE